jgi:hypothetical protein
VLKLLDQSCEMPYKFIILQYNKISSLIISEELKIIHYNLWEIFSDLYTETDCYWNVIDFIQYLFSQEQFISTALHLCYQKESSNKFSLSKVMLQYFHKYSHHLMFKFEFNAAISWIKFSIL